MIVHISRMLLAVLMLLSGAVNAFAGGPINAVGINATTYATDRFPLAYSTDMGSLGNFNNTQATAIATFAFSTWENLSTAALSFTNVGQLDRDVSSSGDSYISGPGQFSDGVFPVVFDSDGSITDARIGVGASQQVFGFASSFSQNGVDFLEGFVVINGALTGREGAEQIYREVITHEVGHMLGIGHSQIGIRADYSLMYPTTLTFDDVLNIGPDDGAAMSMLYPAPGFLGTVGGISGFVTNEVGAVLSGVNVVAVDSATGALYSTVSDYHSGNDGRFLNKPDRTGEYTLRGLPPGTYFVRIEPINPLFQGGSSVASYSTPVNPDVWREWYNGENESGNMLQDNSNEKTGVVVTAGALTKEINIQANGSPTLTTLVEHNDVQFQAVPLPLPAGTANLTRFATRYTAPENGSLLGVRFRTLAESVMPEGSSITVSVHENTDGSLAGIPGEELGSVTIPMGDLAADQSNEIWLRELGQPMNFFQGQKFHIAIRINGDGLLNCLFDNAQGTRNQTSYYVQESGRWFNFPDGLQNGAQGVNIFMEAIYTSVPAGTPLPLIGVSPTTLNFGSTRVGKQTVQEVQVRNFGTADLNVTDVFLSGSNSDKFSIESGGGAFILKSGEMRFVRLGFTPQSTGSVQALLQFAHNATGSPTIISLTGGGKEPILNPLVSSIDFGVQEVNKAVQQTEGLLRNIGSDSLNITALQFDGDGFSLISADVPTFLPPGATYDIRLQFWPTKVQEYTATLRVLHELESSPLEIDLTGTGQDDVGSVPVEIAGEGLSVALHPVGPNPVHERAELSWSVSGAGRMPVEITVVDVAGKEVLRENRELLGDGGTRSETLVLDVKDLTSGEYQVVMRAPNGVAVRKFVLVR